jgi:preprotein translocase subunit SecA
MLYPKIAGMTGTAKTAEIEFQDLYQLDIVVLETNKPTIRKDFSDNIYQSELAKWKAVLKQAKKCFEIGQPLLIGTANVEKSEFLSSLFQNANIPHEVLNAKPENLVRENEIIAQAGKKYAVTIATNMAGRGTDIVLGGNFLFELKEKFLDLFLNNEKKRISTEQKNIEFQINNIKKIYKEKSVEKNLFDLQQDLENFPSSLETCDSSLKEFYEKFVIEEKTKWEKENKEIKEKGGLFVLGTERHESRRIDNQLRGRAGRQGDPGISHFYVSLEDDLLTIFGGTNIQKWVESLMEDKEEPLESSFLTKSLENAQKKIEAYHYEIRKNVFQYDSILNIQRKKVFRSRYQLLCENLYPFFSFQEAEFEHCLENEIKKKEKQNKRKKERKEKKKIVYFDYKRKKKEEISFDELWITCDFRWNQSNIYEIGFLKQKKIEEILSLLDEQWTEHLERTSYARETINWRAYGQQKPLDEYNSETIQSFQLMFQQIRISMLYSFLYSSFLTE